MHRGRPRHADILTPREWQVLELIEAGLTNEEIAERLGISFGTAKYHVGEIISKLGVETREQAVVAARRKRAPALPFWGMGWLRGRFMWPAIGVAAVAAALLLISVVVLTDLLRSRSAPAHEGDLAEAVADFPEGDSASQADLMTRAPAQPSSFHYELSVSSREPGTPENAPRNTTMRAEVWYEAPNKWRTHYSGGDPTVQLSSVHVTDGETEWHYDANDGTYYEKPAGLDPVRGIGARAPRFGPHNAENLDGLMEAESGGPSHYWEVEGPEEVQGIPALRLAKFCCREGALNQLISEERWWVDPTYLFVLRVEQKSPGTGGEILFDVTSVEYNPDLEDEMFIFDPPDGAKEVPPP
jgi:DNA-binding CsgD family transcriptional regulator